MRVYKREENVKIYFIFLENDDDMFKIVECGITTPAVSIASSQSAHVRTQKPSIPSGYVPFCIVSYDASYGGSYPLIVNVINLETDGTVHIQLRNIGSNAINAKIRASILVIKSAVY